MVQGILQNGCGGRCSKVVLQFLMVHLVIETIFLIIDFVADLFIKDFLDSGNMEMEVYRTGEGAVPAGVLPPPLNPTDLCCCYFLFFLT